MSIRLKLIIFFITLSIVPMGLVTVLLITNSTREIKNLVVHEENFVVDQKVRKFEIFLDQFKFIVRSITDFPATQEIIRAFPTGRDPVNQNLLSYWEQRLQQIFTSIMNSKPEIYQLRFLNEKGHELVKVVRDHDSIKALGEKKLQSKSDRYYFKETMRLKKGEVYISDIDLNEEAGKVEIPFKPTLRFATPVFGDSHSAVKGMIVANIDVTSVYDRIQETKIGQMILINQDGTFLLHPDKKKELAPQLGLQHNYFSERPEIKDNLKKYDAKNHYDAEKKEYRIWEKFFFDSSNLNRYWVLFSVFQEKKLLEPVTKLLGFTMLLVGFISISSVLFAYFLAGNILRPIAKIADVAHEVSRGKYGTEIADADARDEVIVLSRTINKMSAILKESFEKNEKIIKELAEKNEAFEKTEEVAQKSVQESAQRQKILQSLLSDLNEGKKKLEEKQVALEKSEKTISEKNHELETLLHVISHDLKEPLRAIENFSSMISKDYASRLDEEGQDLLRRIVEAVGRLRLLLDDILTLSRARLIKRPDKPVEGIEIVRTVLERLGNSILEKKAQIHVAKEFPTLFVDKTWVVQAVYNLIANALKFTVEGKAPDLEIAPYEPIGDEPPGLGFVVKDRGPGVRPEHAKRIFDLFQRAVGREVEGTGAGLAIVKEVATRHGGKAWVRPREGGGSEFIVTFGKENS